MLATAGAEVLISSLTLVVKFDGKFAFACGSSPASAAAQRPSDAAHDRRGHVAYGHCGIISECGRDVLRNGYESLGADQFDF
jgi:hypothetical protein